MCLKRAGIFMFTRTKEKVDRRPESEGIADRIAALFHALYILQLRRLHDGRRYLGHRIKELPLLSRVGSQFLGPLRSEGIAGLTVSSTALEVSCHCLLHRLLIIP